MTATINMRTYEKNLFLIHQIKCSIQNACKAKKTHLIRRKFTDSSKGLVAVALFHVVAFSMLRSRTREGEFEFAHPMQ